MQKSHSYVIVILASILQASFFTATANASEALGWWERTPNTELVLIIGDPPNLHLIFADKASLYKFNYGKEKQIIQSIEVIRYIQGSDTMIATEFNFNCAARTARTALVWNRNGTAIELEPNRPLNEADLAADIENHNAWNKAANDAASGPNDIVYRKWEPVEKNTNLDVVMRYACAPETLAEAGFEIMNFGPIPAYAAGNFFIKNIANKLVKPSTPKDSKVPLNASTSSSTNTDTNTNTRPAPSLTEQTPSNPYGSRSDSVIVLSVDSEGGLLSLIGSAFTFYHVRDMQGREWMLAAKGNKPEFRVGQCVTRWRAPYNPKVSASRYYPYIAPANNDCSAVMVEDPERRKSRYKYPVDAYFLMAASWADLPEQALLDTWGVPDKSYASGDSKFLNYYSGYQRTTTNGFGAVTNQETYYCDVTFEVRNGLVFYIRWKGNDCRVKK